MIRHTVSARARIPAPPERVHAVISDYRVGHPAILPPAYFKKLEVEQGGRGAGSILLVEMEVLGSRRSFRQVVSEPEPGRVLVEANTDGAAVTTFTFNPVDDGQATLLDISTDMALSSGLRGQVEKLLISFVFPSIYRQELANLAAYVQKETGETSS